MNWKPLAGAALLAAGRGAAGIAQFEGTVAAFGASLAPWAAFALVAAAWRLLHGHPVAAVATVLGMVVAQLAPAVLSHALAVRWKCEAEWLRYATAFNWCQWVVPFAFVAALAVLGNGEPDEGAIEAAVVVVGVYALWLFTLLARHGLGLGWGRAVLLALGVNLLTGALVLLPQLAALAVNGVPLAVPNGAGS